MKPLRRRRAPTKGRSRPTLLMKAILRCPFSRGQTIIAIFPFVPGRGDPTLLEMKLATPAKVGNSQKMHNPLNGPTFALPRAALLRYSFIEGAMEGPTVCVQCDMLEERCTCEKYCTICKGQQNIRLCLDGLYYC